ncbi:hypothetical protein HK096_001576, partial [Nowakowskiella sp. JEL0078]
MPVNIQPVEEVLWHQRLGHVGRDRTREIQNVVDGVPVLKQLAGLCTTCFSCKSIRRSFNGTRSPTTKLWQKIHSDTLSGMPKALGSGNTSGQLFIDEA